MTIVTMQELVRANRKWCPIQWLDETVLALVVNPEDALLDRGPHKSWCLVEDLYRRATPKAQLRDTFHEIDLEPGQVVDWCWTETRGDFVLTVAPDRTWSIDGPMPTQVTCWWMPFDGDTVSDDLNTMVSACDLEPGEHAVQAYFWSEAIPLRFELGDGFGRFVPASF